MLTLKNGLPFANVVIKGVIMGEIFVAPTLIVDTSTYVTQACLFHKRSIVGQCAQQSGALEGLFTCVETTLRTAQLQLQDVRHLLLCNGPGSNLGLNIARLAVQTWAQVAAFTGKLCLYSSIDLSMRILENQGIMLPFAVWTETTSGQCLMAHVADTTCNVEPQTATLPVDVTPRTFRLAQRNLPQLSHWPQVPYAVNQPAAIWAKVPLQKTEVQQIVT